MFCFRYDGWWSFFWAIEYSPFFVCELYSEASVFILICVEFFGLEIGFSRDDYRFSCLTTLTSNFYGPLWLFMLHLAWWFRQQDAVEYPFFWLFYSLYYLLWGVLVFSLELFSFDWPFFSTFFTSACFRTLWRSITSTWIDEMLSPLFFFSLFFFYKG